MSMEQISILPMVMSDEDAEKLKRQAEQIAEYAKAKRKWENAFQRWSDKQMQDAYTSLGICGYGSMCDYCEDNSRGRPCVRALNAMCREKHIKIDYNNYNFEKIWRYGYERRSKQCY